jgi:hypothetical protein
MNEYASFPPTFFKTSSVKWVGKGSCKKSSFNFLRSTQILVLPCFFSYTTMGLIHSTYSTGSMIPASSIGSSSSFTFFLYNKFILYGLCLTVLASSFRGIFISPSSPTIPFIFVKVVGNMSLYSCNNYVILSSVFSSQ